MYTKSTLTSAGVTPLMRDAWPMEAGFNLVTSIKAKRFSLKGIYKYYFEKDIEKEVRNEFLTWGNNSFTAEQIHYGAKDIIYPLQIKQQQEVWIKRYALDKTISLENKVLLALGDIEYNGMKIDTAKWKNISVIIKERLKNTIAELDSILIKQNKKVIFDSHEYYYEQIKTKEYIPAIFRNIIAA